MNHNERKTAGVPTFKKTPSALSETIKEDESGWRKICFGNRCS